MAYSLDYFLEQDASFLEQEASFLEQDASFLLQEASALAPSFLEQDASFLPQEASAPDAALAEVAFLPQVPAPHFFCAGSAAKAAEDATMAAARVAMDLKFMVCSFELNVHQPCTLTQSG
jgi:hypothetical protein